MSQPYLNKGGEANVSTGCARKVTAGVVGKLELPNSNSKKRMMTRNMSVFGKIIFFQVLCSKNGLSQNIDCKGQCFEQQVYYNHRITTFMTLGGTALLSLTE